MKVCSSPRLKGRLAAPLFLFLSGMAVPVALGAARGQASPSEPFGRIGIHRMIPNALVYEQGGQVRVLTYSKSAVPQRYGMITMTGDVRTWSLREAMEELGQKDDVKPAGSGEGDGADPVRPGPEPETKQRRSPKKD